MTVRPILPFADLLDIDISFHSHHLVTIKSHDLKIVHTSNMTVLDKSITSNSFSSCENQTFLSDQVIKGHCNDLRISNTRS